MPSGLRRAHADIATMNTLFPAAERLATDDGMDRPGSEHLLLAALDLPDGVARDALAGVGVGPSRLRDAIRAQHAATPRGAGMVADDNAIDRQRPAAGPPTGAYRSQGSLQDAFRRATELAKASRVPIGSGHVMLAALEPEYGTLARAFNDLGVDRDAPMAAVRAALRA